MNTEIFTIRKRLKSKLDPMRYEHSLSVFLYLRRTGDALRI